LKPAEQLPRRTKSGKTNHNGLRFLRIQTQTVLSGPDIQSIKVSIQTTNTFIEAAWIFTQIELQLVGVYMKSTEVNLGNNIVDKYREK
jgi:hypothetical protein